MLSLQRRIASQTEIFIPKREIDESTARARYSHNDPHTLPDRETIVSDVFELGLAGHDAAQSVVDVGVCYAQLEKSVFKNWMVPSV